MQPVYYAIAGTAIVFALGIGVATQHMDKASFQCPAGLRQAAGQALGIRLVLNTVNGESEESLQDVARQLIKAQRWASALPSLCEKAAYGYWITYVYAQIPKARDARARNEATAQAAGIITRPPGFQ